MLLNIKQVFRAKDFTNKADSKMIGDLIPF